MMNEEAMLAIRKPALLFWMYFITQDMTVQYQMSKIGLDNRS